MSMLISVQFTFRMGEKYEKQRDYLSLCCGFIAVRISSEEKFWPPLVLPEQSPTRSESATHSTVLFHTSYRRLVAYSTESPHLADRTETHQSVWIKVTWNGSDFFCIPTQPTGRKRERERPGADNVEKSTDHPHVCMVAFAWSRSREQVVPAILPVLSVWTEAGSHLPQNTYSSHYPGFRDRAELFLHPTTVGGVSDFGFCLSGNSSDLPNASHPAG